MFYSPLRYPGGKNKLAKFISQICKLNHIDGHYVEPYAGGASVALFLLLNGHVSKITINDVDRSIYAFWYSVLKDTKKFCDLIEKTEVTMESWDKAKEIQNNKDKSPLLQLGFSTFFLNRTNVSGIINAGMIGGRKQDGEYKIDCRFNKKNLIARIKLIADQKENIELHNLDAIELIDKIQKESKNSKTIFYFDPPYYLKGKSLYMNHYQHDDHEAVSEAIKGIKNIHWITSYDNTPEIKELYKDDDIQKQEYSFFHTAHTIKQGEEILFFSKNLRLPEVSNPTKMHPSAGHRLPTRPHVHVGDNPKTIP